MSEYNGIPCLGLMLGVWWATLTVSGHRKLSSHFIAPPIALIFQLESGVSIARAT